MDEAEKVLERLRRIRELDEARAAPALLIDELRELVSEAEGWVRVEGDARARAAARELGDAVRQGELREGVIEHRVAVG
jgi:hypothetical protein